MIRILLSAKMGERRITQAELARKTGIRPNTINDLYHELTPHINLEHIEAICEALGCTFSEIMVWEPGKKEYHSRAKK